MNVFNVHVNRSPMSGKITNKNYIPGLFFNATLDKASNENERMSLVMDFDKNKKIAFVQIAGLVARRIITEVEIGSELKMGEVFGLIRFGSRCLLSRGNYKGFKGQTAIAGETVIAELKKLKIKNLKMNMKGLKLAKGLFLKPTRFSVSDVSKFFNNLCFDLWFTGNVSSFIRQLEHGNNFNNYCSIV